MKKMAAELKKVNFPRCTTICKTFEYFGVNKCKFVCHEKFDEKGNAVREKTMHEYHCMFCGKQLFEIGLGCLACDCGRQYIPFYDHPKGNPSLTCINEDNHYTWETCRIDEM